MRKYDYSRVCSECSYIVKSGIAWEDAVKVYNIKDERYYLMILIHTQGISAARHTLRNLDINDINDINNII